MRPSQSPTLLSLLAVILSSTHSTHATPYQKPAPRALNLEETLQRRQCANPCGWSGQLCCESSQSCFTNSLGQAECGSSSSGSGSGVQQDNVNNDNGQWQMFTTTYTTGYQTTVTSTGSTLVGGAATPAVQQVAPSVTSIPCNTEMGESPCGSCCCAAAQMCVTPGTCGVSGANDFSSSYLLSVMSTASNSAFIRPTSQAVTSVTGSPTMTTAFQTPAPTGSTAPGTAGMAATTTNNGLSGGAIAGIVIGVLLAILLLLCICACFCFKSIWDGFLALLGLGRRKKRRTVVEERFESSHRRSGGAGAGRRWFGVGPARVERVEKKKESGIGGWTAVGATLAALAVFLGLKRRRDRRDEKSDVSYSSGSYTYSSDYSASE